MTKNPKTIMHLIATNFFGGPEKQIVEHLKRLDQRRFAGQVASYLEYGEPNELLEKAAAEGIRTHGIPMQGPLDFRAQFKLNTLIVEEGVDLLCTHGYKACVMGWWARKKFDIPVIAFSRGYTSENLKIAFYNWLERKVLGKLDGIIAVSKGQRKRLESLGICSDRNWIVHNAISGNSKKENVDPTLRRQVFANLNIPPNSKLVVTAGRLSPEKGHRYLIDAIAKMDTREPAAFFVFCGEGMCQPDLKKKALNLGVYEICRFPGFRRDLDKIFQVMDLMVLPSLTEGLPNVVLEAFAAKKPVVATSVGGVPEVVDDGVNGFLCSPRDPESLAEAIQKALSQKERFVEMGLAGFAKVQSEFSIEAQTRSLERIYSELAERRRHARQIKT